MPGQPKAGRNEGAIAGTDVRAIVLGLTHRKSYWDNFAIAALKTLTVFALAAAPSAPG